MWTHLCVACAKLELDIFAYCSGGTVWPCSSASFCSELCPIFPVCFGLVDGRFDQSPSNLACDLRERGAEVSAKEIGEWAT